MHMRIARFVCSLMLLAGVIVGGVDSAGAQGSDAAREACTPDAMRLCSEFIPDVPKVTACMHAKSAQLSQPCRVAMGGGGGGNHGYRHRVRHCSKYSHHCG
jgi:hypothetical protein